MPACGIIQCAAKKDNIHKDLTLHLIPTNVSLRQKWLAVIGGEENIRPACRHRPFICSLHFKRKYFNKSLRRTRLSPDAVPSPNLMPWKSSVPPNRNGAKVEALKLSETIQITSTVAQKPVKKVQPKPKLALKPCRDCNDVHPTTSTPLVIIDIPPMAPILPIFKKETPIPQTKKELSLLNRCEYLGKQLRAWKQKVRRRIAMIQKLEAEKKELAQQHLKTLELLKRDDNTDHRFEDILHKAVIKLS